jgi:hypothetical protein
MHPLAKTGAIIVVCALASYSVAVLAEQRRRLVTPLVLLFLTLGVMLDVTATAFMIALVGSVRASSSGTRRSRA